jgi:hypothetical protein
MNGAVPHLEIDIGEPWSDASRVAEDILFVYGVLIGDQVEIGFGKPYRVHGID